MAIEKVSDLKDKSLDPRTFSYKLKHPTRKSLNHLLDETKDLKHNQKAWQEVKSFLEKLEDSKEPMTYDEVSQLHKSFQRLDSSDDLFYFFNFLDEFRPIIPEQRSVSFSTVV